MNFYISVWSALAKWDLMSLSLALAVPFPIFSHLYKKNTKKTIKCSNNQTNAAEKDSRLLKLVIGRQLSKYSSVMTEWHNPKSWHENLFRDGINSHTHEKVFYTIRNMNRQETPDIAKFQFQMLLAASLSVFFNLWWIRLKWLSYNYTYLHSSEWKWHSE